MRATDSRHVVEGISALTFAAVGHEMEFRDRPTQSFVAEIKLEALGIFVHSPKKIDGVRTCDVVRYVEDQDVDIGETERREENEIHVALPTSWKLISQSVVGGRNLVIGRTFPHVADRQLRVCGSSSGESRRRHQHHLPASDVGPEYWRHRVRGDWSRNTSSINNIISQSYFIET